MSASAELAVGGGQTLPVRKPRLPRGGLIALVRGVVEEGGSLWVGAEGWSMSPTIRVGDNVLLERADNARVGDVVLLDLDGTPVLHRVIDVGEGKVWTAGDGLPRPDAPVTLEHVVARAVARERGGRTTALRWEPSLGAIALARGLWWRARIGVARGVRAARSARGGS